MIANANFAQPTGVDQRGMGTTCVANGIVSRWRFVRIDFGARLFRLRRYSRQDWICRCWEGASRAEPAIQQYFERKHDRYKSVLSLKHGMVLLYESSHLLLCPKADARIRLLSKEAQTRFICIIHTFTLASMYLSRYETQLPVGYNTQ